MPAGSLWALRLRSRALPRTTETAAIAASARDTPRTACCPCGRVAPPRPCMPSGRLLATRRTCMLTRPPPRMAGGRPINRNEQ